MLFTLPPSSVSPSILSLRHDIDALLYTPSPSPITFSHTMTFNALAYVQASKREKKFLTGTSNGSYAALSDTSCHVFVYSQPFQGVKGNMAYQYVHTLSDGSGVLGLQLSKDKLLFVLTDNLLSVLKLP